jgi:predicted nucleic acid-binding protein
MNALPNGPLLLDTGIYIRAARGEDYLWLTEDDQIFVRTVLSAVVAAELYAGTRDHREKRALDQLCRAYNALGHFLSPSTSAWTDCGMLLRRASNTSGQTAFAYHFRDVLIAEESERAGATLVTENVKDFERWKALLASGRRKLKLFDPS